MTAQNAMAPLAPTQDNQVADRATLTAAVPVKQVAVDRKRSSRLADDRRFKIFSGEKGADRV